MKKAGQILLTTIIWELCLGGGGRLTAFGPISLRMILFVLATLLAITLILNGKRPSPIYTKALVMFLAGILMGVITGVLNNAPLHYLWEDVKPLLYFLMLMFFSVTIIEHSVIEKNARIIVLSSLILAVLYFCSLALIHTKAIPFLTFYHAVIGTEEFFFRGEYTYSYKGFLFFGVGIIFLALTKRKHQGVFIALLLSGLFISFTRGFILSLGLTLAIYFLFQKKLIWSVLLLVASASILFFGGRGIAYLSERLGRTYPTNQTAASPERITKLLGDREYSNNQRLIQLSEVADRITFSSFLIGHGFGNGVPSKPVHMEIAYLEIFHKQGIFGLFLWSLLAWQIFISFLRVRTSPTAQAYFFSSIFVFVESFTNQYINNPIGLSVVLLSWVSLNQLQEHE